MSCTPLPKAAKPVWAKQLNRLPCLVVYVKFQFEVIVVYAIKVNTLCMQDRWRNFLYQKWEERVSPACACSFLLHIFKRLKRGERLP